MTQLAKEKGTYLNWDLRSGNPMVNPMSDACLVFINAMATEGWDRDGLHDDFSDGLVLNVASKCANTIVIIHAAGIRLVDQWIEHPNVTATMIAHLPGQDVGESLVSLLYGEVSPSGKLPYTLARNESDYGDLYAPCKPASVDDHFPQCNYTEGVYIDYRHFDAHNIEPRYEFGFGLSYTTFEYSGGSVKAAPPPPPPSSLEEGNLSQRVMRSDSMWDTAATVTATITNTGPVAAEEVAQLYVGIPGGGSPARQLRGFEKVRLAPGGSAAVSFELTRRDLSVWDVASQGWVLQPGSYDLYVGSSSRDIRWKGVYEI
jgi:beta-glucosidase